MSHFAELLSADSEESDIALGSSRDAAAVVAASLELTILDSPFGESLGSFLSLICRKF